MAQFRVEVSYEQVVGLVLVLAARVRSHPSARLFPETLVEQHRALGKVVRERGPVAFAVAVDDDGGILGHVVAIGSQVRHDCGRTPGPRVLLGPAVELQDIGLDPDVDGAVAVQLDIAVDHRPLGKRRPEPQLPRHLARRAQRDEVAASAHMRQE